MAFAAIKIRLSHAPDSIVAQKDSTAAFSHSREKSAIPEEPEHWSVTTLREKLVKIGAKVVRHGRSVTFQLAEVAISRRLFAAILQLIDGLRPKPAPT